MKKSLITLLWVFALGRSAQAQDMSFGVDETSGEDTSKEETKPSTETEAEGTAEGSVETDASGNLDVIGELAASSKDGAATNQSTGPKKKEVVEEIYAVQQMYALRLNRLELAPSAAFTVNDPYVSHPAPGLALNYWWTNVLALGLNVLWYQGLENTSDLNFFVQRSTRLVVPITEYQMGLHLNFSYVPIYGKFSMFNDSIFQWDSYVVGGVGTMRTRPVPVVDPEVRQFDFDWRLAFNAGLGIRVFVTRYLSIFSEIRDYAFLERYENQQVSLGASRTDPDTWVEDSPTLTHNVMVHLGATIFFPFTFEYKRPR